ncbi:site-specific integrase [Saccharomonospora marina]|uniref:hypothetical protein n=1 Tax=Saccharomonospora marina TaxID=632569 RepID=UPI00031D0A51|nr:hypothetical protein [Saccharomonospora marina]
MADDWGTLVRLAMTACMRRGELVRLRLSRIDLDAQVIDPRRSWVGVREKGTKTRQNRRIVLGTETVGLPGQHESRVTSRVESIGVACTDDLFAFCGGKTPDHSEPCSPNAVTQRFFEERLEGLLDLLGFRVGATVATLPMESVP